jgi:hypothetical protein
MSLDTFVHILALLAYAIEIINAGPKALEKIAHNVGRWK